MNIGYADFIPNLLRYKNNKVRVYFDVEKEYNEQNEKDHYKFVYVDILPTYTRGQIIDAIISNKYSKDTEIALINNELVSPGTEAYAEYQVYRLHAKELASEILANL
jgi:hypothetical protein